MASTTTYVRIKSRRQKVQKLQTLQSDEVCQKLKYFNPKVTFLKNVVLALNSALILTCVNSCTY